MSTTERRLCGAVFTAVLLLDLSFRSYYFNFDGVACAIAVELSDAKHLVHGNHLAYGVLAWLFDRLWRLLGYRGQALLALQVLDAVLGAAGAAAFASLLRRAKHSEREAALGGMALAVSYAWWFWSLEAQVYMLGAFFATLAAREALSDRPRPGWVGLWQSLAVLGHVGHLMSLPALAWILTRGRKRAVLAPYLGTLAAVTLAAYAAAGLFAVRPQSLAEAKLWLLGSAALTVDRSFAWHADPLMVAVPAWAGMTLRVFCEFVGRSGFARLVGAALAALPLAAAVRGGVIGGRATRFWLIWLAGYAVLFMMWEPGTIVYRVSDLVALWALAFAAVAKFPVRARSAALAAWICAAFSYNLAFNVLPAADPAANADLVEARWVAAHAPEDAWILVHGRGQVYIPYFAHRKPENLRYLAAPEALVARLDARAARGEAVYVTDRTVDLAGLHGLLTRYGLSVAAVGDGWTLYRCARTARSPVISRPLKSA